MTLMDWYSVRYWYLIIGLIIAVIDLTTYQYWKYEKSTWFGVVCIFLFVTICFPIFIIDVLIKAFTPRE